MDRMKFDDNKAKIISWVTAIVLPILVFLGNGASIDNMERILIAFLCLLPLVNAILITISERFKEFCLRNFNYSYQMQVLMYWLEMMLFGMNYSLNDPNWKFWLEIGFLIISQLFLWLYGKHYEKSMN